MDDLISRPEIIYCRDCKHWKNYNDKFGTCNLERWTDEGRYITHNEEFYEDFCSHAERRESV